MEAAAASFSTCTDSIMLGSKSAKVFVPVTGDTKECIGTPSTTQSGWPSLAPFTSRELNPRTAITAALPGAPDCWIMFTPAKRPCNMLVILAEGSSFISSAVTVEMALTTSLFFWLPYARTTTSFKSETSSFMVMCRVSVFVLNLTRSVLKPTKDKIKVP